MVKEQFMTAEEAAAYLKISRATLYAYVSRGLIRSQPAGDDSRRHYYAAADVEALQQKQEGRRNPAVVAESVLDWGLPVLESGITLIGDGRLYYRGYDALALALQTRFENAAGLIWSGELDTNPFKHVNAAMPSGWESSNRGGPTERFQALMISAAVADPAAYDLRPNRVLSSGARIVTLLTQDLAAVPWSGKGAAADLQIGWDLPLEADEVLNAALILCADHELNVSAFTARCIASAGSNPYAVVLGGLAALQGIKHGGHTARVQALFDEVERPNMALAVLSARLRRGEHLPGFGHPLYADGDPRAALLLDLVQKGWGNSPAWELAVRVNEAADQLLGERPTVDFALVTMARALKLPPGSALALFALGRTVGWIGHALEQYEAGQLIRPRARYVGERPER